MPQASLPSRDLLSCVQVPNRNLAILHFSDCEPSAVLRDRQSFLRSLGKKPFRQVLGFGGGPRGE